MKKIFCRKIFIVCILSLSQSGLAADKPGSKELDKKPAETYVFQPLLIRGKRLSFRKSKDVQKQGRWILESELFFENIDFKKRIFTD